MTKRYLSLLLPLLSFPSGGCEPGRTVDHFESALAGVPVDTIGGTLVVRNGPDAPWTEQTQWSIREDLRIGSVEGRPHTNFTGPLTSVSFGPNGQIFVLDLDAYQIEVFDQSGEFIRTIGRPGRGPGEFTAPSAMAWDMEGRLWVSNEFNGRYDVFDSTGGHLKTVPRPIRAAARMQHELVVDNDGFILDEASSAGDVVFLRVDSMGVIDTFPPIPRRSRPNFFLPRDFDRLALKYLPTLVWALAPDRTVWFADASELRLFQRTLEGDTIRIVETQHRPVENEGRLEDWIEGEFYKAGVPRSQLMLARPIIQAIHILGDGHLLVQIAEEVGVDSALFDVFDPEGRFLGSLRSPFSWNTLGMSSFRGDTVATVTIGEFDVPYVVLATLTRGSR